MRIPMLLSLVLLCLAGAAAQTPSVPFALTASAHLDHVDVAGREPMVVEHPDGSLFVVAFGDPPRPTLWKSSDRGTTWKRVDVGTDAQGAVGNSDVALAVGNDGTLYFANLLFDRVKREGAQVSVAVSRDAGATWRWSVLAKEPFTDRPWVVVTAEGVAHAIWSDATGVRHALSRDRGVTWSEGPRVFPTGGSSHLAVGPAGELAARISPAYGGGRKYATGVDRIAISLDGGESWHDRPAVGERPWSQQPLAFPPRWVEPLAWDSRGALYAFGTHPEGLWLARSSDRGATWSMWNLARSDDPAYYPYLVARGPGELAASWFSGRDATLRLHVARIDVPVQGTPRLLRAEPIEVDAWSRMNSAFRDPAREYVGIALLRDGSIGVPAPIFNPREKRFGFAWWRFAARKD